MILYVLNISYSAFHFPNVKKRKKRKFINFAIKMVNSNILSSTNSFRKRVENVTIVTASAYFKIYTLVTLQ